jgi:hypothetical protein
MAKVTGFTAERMLVIENETVVDGEVQGDNLILLTREGTPIDAGNVRGPQGPQGTPGAPSGATSVNDQTGAVYSPRIFANRAAIDTDWAAAPNGAVAVTIDSEVIWEKNGGGWVATRPSRIFATSSELTSKWATPPEGAHAVTTDNDVGWYKAPAGWNIDNAVRVFSNAAERDVRWPSPPQGACCITADNDAFYQRRGGVWTPPIGTLIASYNAGVTQTQLVGAGNRGVGEIATAVTFPFPTRSVATYYSQGGAAPDWCGWSAQIWSFSLNVGMGGITEAAGIGVWTSASYTAWWTQGPNASVGFQAQCNPYQFGGGTNWMWHAGNMSLHVYAA